MTAWPYRFRARLVKVRDADSYVFAADLGLRVTHELVVRLAGCNAPESKTPEGEKATAFATDWLAEYADPDGWLALTTKKDPGDRYGRWLAQVQSLDGSRDLTEDLITGGHAAKWDGAGAKPVPDPAVLLG